MPHEFEPIEIVLGWENFTYTCMKTESSVGSYGIFVGENPLKRTFPLFLAQIGLAQILSQALYLLLRPLKQPRFVCNVLGGIALGPSFLGRNKTFANTMFPSRQKILLDMTDTLGVTYFLFLSMVKMDVALTLRTAKNAWSIGVSCLVMPLAFVIFLSFAFKREQLFSQMHGNAFVMLSSFALSHFPNIVQALDELKLLNSHLGQAALSSAMVDELFALTVVVFGILFRHTLHSLSVSISMSFVVFFMLVIVRPMILEIIENSPDGKPVEEKYVIKILLGVAFMSLVTNSIGGALTGALILGLAIPNGRPLGAILVEKSELIVMEVLMPAFFICIGLQTDVHVIESWKDFAVFFAIVITVMLLKVLGAFLPAVYLCKIEAREAFALGLVLNVKGIIELTLFHQWMESKLIDEHSFIVLLLSDLLATAIIVPLTEILYKPQAATDPLGLMESTIIQSIAFNEELRILTCIHREENVHGIITLLELTNPTVNQPIFVCPVHLIGSAAQTAPLVIEYHQHKDALNSKSSDLIMSVFSNYAKSSMGSVVSQPFTVIAPYKIMHENIQSLAKEMLVHLIIIPFRKRHHDDVMEATALSCVNGNVQKSALCTVGILVERSTHRGGRGMNFYHNIAMIFIGGPDDREALAFTIRALDCPGIRITLLKIVLLENAETDYQKKLDDMLLQEFMRRNEEGKGNVTCREVTIEDGIQVMDEIRLLGKDYDLIVVGYRPITNSLSDEDMFGWMENPELGVLGDLIASEDFFGDSTSVLVMHRQQETSGNYDRYFL